MNDPLSEKWAAVKEARDRADKAEMRLKDLEWCLKRITEDLKKIGIEVSWTDGGGAAAPSGWHRNPYIQSMSWAQMKEAMENALVEAQRSASETYKVVVGERDIAENKVVALERELIEMVGAAATQQRKRWDAEVTLGVIRDAWKDLKEEHTGFDMCFPGEEDEGCKAPACLIEQALKEDK
jgi:hypothetical protein